MVTDITPQQDSLGETWVTLSEAAELLGMSTDRLRRKLSSGAIPGQFVFDPKIGRKRWMVNTSRLSIPAPDVGVVSAPHVASDLGGSVSMEALHRLEEAWAQVRDAVVRAEVAEHRADIEKQRRKDAEHERDRLLRAHEQLRTWWKR